MRDNLYTKSMKYIEEFTNSPKLRNELKSFVMLVLEIHNENKRPIYFNQMKGKINKLSELTSDLDESIKIVQQSINNGWESFWPLKTNTGYSKRRGNPENLTAEQHQFDGDESKLAHDENGNLRRF